jgi:cytochrome b6-f complex iron-sulfur subunit
MVDEQKNPLSRRQFLSWIVLGGSLTAAYGLFTVFGARFLYPKKHSARIREIFVATKQDIIKKSPFTWTAPSGQKVIINNIDGKLRALSNICPHLGCKVHWESVNNQFFCPCHAGVFNAQGVATAGPPKDEGKNLEQFDLITDGDAVFMKWEDA